MCSRHWGYAATVSDSQPVSLSFTHQAESSSWDTPVELASRTHTRSICLRWAVKAMHGLSYRAQI